MAPRDQMAGVVISAGKMMKTVKVQMWKQQWNRKLRKNYLVPYTLLVRDHNNSVIEGDRITITPERHGGHVFHAVESIQAPFGKPLEERPRLPKAILEAEKETRRLEKETQQVEEEMQLLEGKMRLVVEDQKQRSSATLAR